jgi:hypothetical protein
MNGQARIIISPMRTQKIAATGATKNAPTPYQKGEQGTGEEPATAPSLDLTGAFMGLYRVRGSALSRSLSLIVLQPPVPLQLPVFDQPGILGVDLV